jgi:hypothetical protein
VPSNAAVISGAQGCVVATRSDTQQHVPGEQTLGGLIQVNGRVDPKTRNTHLDFQRQ